jgi:hypothetical protein
LRLQVDIGLLALVVAFRRGIHLVLQLPNAVLQVLQFGLAF